MPIIILVRHGETYANQRGYLQGTLNTSFASLTDKGRADASLLAPVIGKFNVDIAYVSPLNRAIETYHIICPGTRVPIRIDNRLTELSYGSWNGQLITELKKQYPNCFNEKMQDVCPEAYKVNSGESYMQAIFRLTSFLADLQKQGSTDQKVLVVTHGWVIKTLVSILLGLDVHEGFKIPANLSVTKIITNHSTSTLCFYDKQMEEWNMSFEPA